MDIGKSIRVGLANRNWKRVKLAQLMGVAPSRINQIEKTGIATSTTLSALANAFGVSVSEFIKWGE